MFKNILPTDQSLIKRDHNLLWHPYAPLNARPLYAVTDAYRSQLTLQTPQGETHTVVDAMSSWWCQVHGYKNPVLDQALAQQASSFSHVMFGGLTHQPAIELAERLRDLAPGDLNHVFLADSGSISVEVSLKLAVQYQAACSKPERRRFIALRGGYHGDTIGAMGVSDPEGGMHRDFSQLVQSQFFIPRPPQAQYDPQTQQWSVDASAQEQWEADATACVEQHQRQSAGIIVEPIVQGAGGMHFYHPKCLTYLRQLADTYGLLLIFDEIATGFGRTGKLFASHWANVVPDVMTVGKALTGGYMTQGAVLVTSDIAQVITRSDKKALMHGPTFMGNPLASAVSCASLDLLVSATSESHWQQQVPRLHQQLAAGLASAQELGSVKDVRVLGGIGVIELHDAVDVTAVAECALHKGVWVRPFRNLVYTMPTYICSDDELARLTAGLCQAVEQVHGA